MIVPYDILKSRTQASAEVVLNELKPVSAEDIISDLFVHTENVVAKHLIQRLEAMLVLAKVHPDRFRKKFHSLLQETSHFIEKNNLYREFYEFSYFVTATMTLRGAKEPVYLAYLDIVLQLNNYFCSTNEIVYGVTTDGNLIIRKDPLPYLDVPSRHLAKKGVTDWNLVLKEFRKLGYNISTSDDMFELQVKDEMNSNTAFRMAPFINENTQDMLPEKMYYPVQGMNQLRQWKPTAFYKELLTARRYQLPPRGVTGTYINALDIYKIRFREIYQNNSIILLYQVFNHNMESFTGYYDTKLQVFYSIFKDTQGEVLYHGFVENFILENYCHLTTDMEIDRNRKKALFVTDDLEAPSEYVYDDRIRVRFDYQSSLHDETSEKRTRLFDKKNYEEAEVQINPFIRKLPIGATASEEAIKLAREMGYVLSLGETFVKPHSRKTYHKKE